jgi:hypothetical protein
MTLEDTPICTPNLCMDQPASSSFIAVLSMLSSGSLSHLLTAMAMPDRKLVLFGLEFTRLEVKE